VEVVRTDFKFSEEEELFRKALIEFCERYIAPVWVELDEKGGGIPPELYKRCAEQGITSIIYPEEYGGMGGTFTMACIAGEVLGYYDPSIAIPVGTVVVTNGWTAILTFYGTEEAKSEILPKVAEGTGFFGIATTEPQGGSDIPGIKTRAVRKDGKWVINGEKAYISGVKEVLDLSWGGGWFLLAYTKPELLHRGQTAFAFLAKKDGEVVPGFEHTLYEDWGRCGLSCGGFTLTDAEIEDKYMIGKEGHGFYHTMEGFNLARIILSATTIGSARWALDQAKEWITTRKLFGRPISKFQNISYRFAELYAKLEAARLAVYRAAWVADQIYVEKKPGWKRTDLNVPASIAKMMGPETCHEVYEQVLKWYGAYGYTRECPVFRGHHGTWSYIIGAEGAQDVQRYIIAREVIGREYVRWE